MCSRTSKPCSAEIILYLQMQSKFAAGLIFQAAPVGSAIQDSRVADLVHLSRLADDCRMESFYRCKLDNENTIGKSILIMLM